MEEAFKPVKTGTAGGLLRSLRRRQAGNRESSGAKTPAFCQNAASGWRKRGKGASMSAMSTPPLRALFQPQSVAVVGATDRAGSVGRAVLENLSAFPGPRFAVNPRRERVLGLPCHPSLAAVGQPVDLAVIVTPAAQVPGVVADAVAAGVRGAIVLSAGFRETGAEGAALEQRVLAQARADGLRMIGPNCLGLMVPRLGLNATFATAMALPGSVAFLSQSGALGTAILDWSLREKVGFSSFVSVGSMLDVGWGDLIRHCAADPATESIVLYMESVGDAASFLCAVREVAERKPVVVIKVGRTAAAARAAASHTGAMTGSDAVLDAVLKRVGALRVDTIEELFDVAEILAKQPLPKGPRLGIVTNAGGPGALATDAVVRLGGDLAELSAATLTALDARLPAHWSHGNPVDVLGDADPARFQEALHVVAQDPGVDGLLTILTPQSMTEPTAVADAVAATALDKPVLASWMGADGVVAGRRRLNAAGIPTFDYPDEAARAFVHMWQRRLRLDWLHDTNAAVASCVPAPVPAAAAALLDQAQAEGRTLLSESEAKQLLQAAGIPVVETRVAHSSNAAVQAADALGYPVVVKLHSAVITHKTEVGGVRLNLADAAAVARAWQELERSVSASHGPAAFGGVSVQRMVGGRGQELILGASTDAQFGPVLLFGAGGTLVEVFQDRALALPPLSPALARRWMAETRIWKALQGVRGQPPADLAALEGVLLRFAELVVAEPRIAEIDINPLFASAGGVIALDARVLLHPEGGRGAAPAMCRCGF